MNTYLIVSNDELNQIEVTGESLEQALVNGQDSSLTVICFLEEYDIKNCTVELIGGES